MKPTVIDLTKLTPAPWIASAGMVTDSSDLKPRLADCTWDDVPLETAAANCEFIALARNAFDIMLRRKWAPTYVKDDFWQVEDIEGRCVMIGDGKNWWPDPFTAIVEADRWLASHEERTPERPKGAEHV